MLGPWEQTTYFTSFSKSKAKPLCSNPSNIVELFPVRGSKSLNMRHRDLERSMESRSSKSVSKH